MEVDGGRGRRCFVMPKEMSMVRTTKLEVAERRNRTV
jgi:hypothetical protein